jgi:hypothetical protein
MNIAPLSLVDVNETFPNISFDKKLHPHIFVPEWAFLLDGKLSAMLLFLVGATRYSTSIEDGVLFLILGGLSWSVSYSLFQMIVKKSEERVSLLSSLKDRPSDVIQSSKDVLHQTVDLLSKRVLGIEKRQQSTLEAISASQRILQQLPEHIQKSLREGLAQELRPAVRDLVVQAEKTHDANQSFLQQSSQAQVEGIETLIQSVSQGVQQSFGNALEQTTESFLEAVRQQEHTLTRWGRSVEQVVSVVDGIERTAQVLSAGADQMARAAQPVEAASQMFSQAAENLQKTLPSLASVSDSYMQSQSVLEQAHISLQRGTDQYIEASVQLRGMVQDLKESQGMAVRRISEGVNEAVLEPLKVAGAELTKIQAEQRASLEQWSKSTEAMSSTFSGLESTVIQIAECAKELRSASEPNARAAKTFLQTVIKLESSIQQLDSTTQAQVQSKEMLESSARILKDGMVGYQAASKMLEGMVEKLNEAHGYTLTTLREGVKDTLVDAFSQASTLFSNSIAQTQKNVDEALTSGSTNIEQFSKQWVIVLEDARVLLQESLHESSDIFSRTIEKTGNRLDKTMERASQNIEETLGKSSRNMSSSMLSARQQMVDTISAATERLDHSLRISTEGMTASWKSSGESLSQSLDESSSILQNRMNQAGEQMFLQFENVCIELVSSAQAASDAMRGGASEVKIQLSTIGGGWQESIAKSAQLLLESAEESAKKFHGLGDDLQEKTEEAANVLVKTFRDGSHSIAHELQEAGLSLATTTGGAATRFEHTFDEVRVRLEKGSLEHISAWETQQKNSVSRLEDAAKGLVAALDDSFKGSAQRFVEAAETSANALDKQSQVSVARLDQVGTGMIQSMEQSSGILVRNIESAGQGFTRSAEQAAQVLEHSTERAATQFDEHFVKSAQILSQSYNAAGLDLVRVLGDSAKILVESVAASAGTLTSSTDEGAKKLKDAFSGAENEIRLSLTSLTKILQESLEGSQKKVAILLDQAAKDMTSLSQTQGTHIEQWTGIVQEITPVLSDLNLSTSGLNDLVIRLQTVISPVAEAAKYFHLASTNIQAVFPNIEETASGYQRFNVALSNASESLTSSAHNYQAAGNEMGTLLVDIKQSLLLQTKCNQVFAKTLTQVKASVDAFVPVSVGMQNAAGNVQILSESTAHAVSVIKDATEMQDRSVGQIHEMSQSLMGLFGAQLQQLEQVSGNFVQLQSTLTAGVDAFSEQLPQAVDNTMVHFDAAMGKGVARLGSSVERMREAMDDLVEQLETIFEAKKKK